MFFSFKVNGWSKRWLGNLPIKYIGRDDDNRKDATSTKRTQLPI